MNPECELAQVGTNSERMFTAGWMAARRATTVPAHRRVELLAARARDRRRHRRARRRDDGHGRVADVQWRAAGGRRARRDGHGRRLHPARRSCARRARGRAPRLQFYNAKFARVGDALEGGEEADDRPATKTDVAHINDKFANINDKFANRRSRLDVLARFSGSAVAAAMPACSRRCRLAAAAGRCRPSPGAAPRARGAAHR